MDDLFKSVRSTRKVQNNIEKFETLSLKDASTSRPASTKSKVSIVDLSSENSDAVSEPFDLRPSLDSSKTSVSAHSETKKHKHQDSTAFLQKSYLQNSPTTALPDDARAILKSQPDGEDLSAVVQYLQYGIDGRHDFNVQIPGPKSSQIINALVTVTIPDQWLQLRSSNLPKRDAQLKRSIITCLTSVAGIGALLMQIRRLSSTSTSRNDQVLEDAISILSSVLTDRNIIRCFLSISTKYFTTEASRRAFWQEVTALLAGSKVLTTIAQVFATVQDLNVRLGGCTWLGNGSEYSKWLSRNISGAAIDLNSPIDPNNETLRMLGQLLKRGLSLGYRDVFVTELYGALLLGKKALWTTLHSLLETLPAYDQKAVFDAVLRDIGRKYLHLSIDSMQQETSLSRGSKVISGAAAMVNGLVQGSRMMESHIVHWLTSTSGEYAGLGLGLRRAIIANLAQNEEQLRHILEQTVANFGSKVQIQHDSMLHQESTAQTILLTVGYLSRINPELTKQITTSGIYLQMVSNRLSASVPRARFLGMIVATATSKLVDKSDKIMNFGVEEMEGEEAQYWVQLVNIKDTVGSLDELEPGDSVARRRSHSTLTSEERLKGMSQRNPIPQSSKIISIEELSDSDNEEASESEDEPDLQPYAPPDSDPEDSDEDPTLINRNKPSAPVYITSLIKQLNVTEDLSRIEIALRTAPSLIRRKANFGDELSANILPLASSLLNLQEGMSEKDLQRLRLESLIACLVSKPATMGPWIASMYFEGDFSLSQRAGLLTTIGLGARELAGYNDGPQDLSATTDTSNPTFPSKRLPSGLESLYTNNSSPISTISKDLSYQTLQPMALEAADKLTGPNILKIRTFSSRMEVQKKAAAKSEARSKRIPKDLHKVLTEAIYLPFCSRLSLVLSSISTSAYLANSMLLHPSLLKLSVQTLTIIVATLGPHALQLPTVTRESLILLTTLHTIPTLAHDPTILPSALQLLLTLLDLNIEAGTTAEERLVTEFGTMIAELISWAGDLGERLSIPEVDANDGGEMPWPVLVAGIQVKWHEVGRKFQGRMLGLMAGTDFDSF